MKRLFGSLLMVASIVSLAACNPTGNNDNGGSGGVVGGGENNDGLLKIVMVTSTSTAEDKSFNQGTWEGIKAWAAANGLKDAVDRTNDGNTYQYIRPNSYNTNGYVAAIDTAVEAKADIIIGPGYLFEESFENTVDLYPEVAFIGLDFVVDNITNRKNVINISYKEEESGFLAGYAAVANGQTNLGFIGGKFAPAVTRYGLGYVAGAAYANKELGKNATFTKDHFWYSGTFEIDQKVETTATSWYTSATNPTDVIFAAAAGAGNSVFNAARTLNKPAIGVDVDQGLEAQNTFLLTSAIKGLAPSIQSTLDRIVEGKGVKSDLDGLGGSHRTMGANDNATGLPTDGKVVVDGKEQSTWRLTNWSKDEYNIVLNKIKTGEIVVPTDGEANKSELSEFIAQKGTLAGFDEAFLNYIYTGV